jgi:hypothetical protein
MKYFLHSQTFNSTELHSVTMIPQFLNSIPFHLSIPWLPSHILAGWCLETDLSPLTLLAWGPRYIVSGQTQQKTPFPNNPSIVTCVVVTAGTCLPSRCLAVNVNSGSTIPASCHNILQRFVTRVTDVPSQTKYFRHGYAVRIWNNAAPSPNRELSLSADYYSKFGGQYVMHF